MPSIISMLPAYNEEFSIGGVCSAPGSMPDRVVVIDDGSRDRTAEVAAERLWSISWSLYKGRRTWTARSS